MAAILTLSTGLPALADSFMINATFDSTITSDPNAATIEATINQVIQVYQSKITTPITVAITFAEMTTGLGQSATAGGTIGYSDFLSRLISHADPTSASDTSALASLAGSGPNNPVNGDPNINLSAANLRALGYDFNSGNTDSTIGLNTSIMNLSRSSTDPAKYDLLSTVEHELNEALGLGSRLDSGDITGPIRAEDLFRYSAANTRSYTTDPNAVAYLSVDGGVTNLVNFNPGPAGLADFGDWADRGPNSPPQVQDAFGSPGKFSDFGINEQTALDVIGYNFNASVAVPEPSSLVMVALGLAAAGFRLRHRKPQLATSSAA